MNKAILFILGVMGFLIVGRFIIWLAHQSPLDIFAGVFILASLFGLVLLSSYIRHPANG